MKRGSSKYVLLGFGILLILLLSLNFIAAQNTFGENVGDFFRRYLIGDLGEGAAGPGFAKIWIVVLLTFLIFVIADQIPFLDTAGGFIKLIFSIFVAILSTLYLTPEDVRGILVSYEALGIVLTSFVPFIILFVFTTQWVERGYNRIIPKFLWIGFLVILFIRWIQAPVGATFKIGYPLTIVLTVAMIAWGDKLLKMMRMEKLASDLDDFRDTQERVTAVEKSRADSTRRKKKKR